MIDRTLIGSKMRLVPVLVVAASMLGACKKSSTTAPIVTITVSATGSWSGCLVEPPVTCLPVTMVLTDSAVTDTTGTLRGTGNWSANVTITGVRIDSAVTLHATTVGVLQGYSFAGVIVGSSLAGSMTIPNNASSFQASFTRSP